ncbi:MAG: ABC transporter permease [Myxococcota bacterium]
MTNRIGNGPPRVVIEPRRGLGKLGLREVLEHRELLLMLVQRDLKVRYKQALIGFGWIALQPLMTVTLFALLFQALMRNRPPTPDGIPYVLSTFSVLMVWQMVSASITGSSNSLINNAAVLKKTYFPKLIAPLYPIVAALVDLALVSLVFAILAFGYRIAGFGSIRTGLPLIFFPLFIFFAVMFSVAIGLWLASLNALYRDVKYIVPFMLTVLQFASPVVYTSHSVLHDQPVWLQFVYRLNPLAVVADGIRWSLFGAPPPGAASSVGAAALVIAIGVGGLVFFRATESLVVDVV